MKEPVRKLAFSEEDTHDAEVMLGREWLVTNGLGGFASGTLAGVPTRRYHGLLVAALPTPLGRTVMFNHLSEWLRTPEGARYPVGGQERAGGQLEWPGAEHLREFRLEEGLPVWRYEFEGAVVEKRVLMVHSQNTVHVNYRLVGGEGTLRLKLRPALQFRPLEEAVHGRADEPYTVTSTEDRLELCTGHTKSPPLRLKIFGLRATFALDG